MKKTLIFKLAAFLMMLWVPRLAIAAFPNGTGAATTYEVTITQVEICQSSACGSSTILGSTSDTFDIAGVNAGQEIGQFANADSIPVGIAFSHVKVTLNRTITITGQGTTSGLSQSCSTSSNTQSNATTFGAGSVGGTPVSQTLTAPDTATNINRPGSLGGGASTVQISTAEYSSANITIVNATSLAVTFPLGSTFTRQAGDSEPRVEIAIDTASALGVADSGAGVAASNCVTFPREPTVRVNISIPQ
jgi:hypothetical protein